MPSYAESAYRIALFGDEIEGIQHFDPLTGEILDDIDHVSVWPASHYVTEGRDARARGRGDPRRTRAPARPSSRPRASSSRRTGCGSAPPTTSRCSRRSGFCSGIENYSRILDGRPEGSPPHTLIDYFPDDFVVFVDESHQTIPQIGGMYEGDRSRKQTLIDYGFRLPSAIDNRPLKFDEFLERVDQLVMVSATPGPFEQAESTPGRRADRPPDRDRRPRDRGARDEEPDRRPDERDQGRAEAGDRVLVTTLTKKMAEDLTAYLLEYGIRVRYLHSEIDTLERIQIIRDLRLGRVRRPGRRQPAARGPRPARGLPGRDPRRRQGGLPARRDEPRPDDRPRRPQRRRAGC